MLTVLRTIMCNLTLNSVKGFVRNEVWAAVVIVAIGLSSGQSADASCGDYLFRNGKPVSGHEMANDHMVHERDIAVDYATLPDTPSQDPFRRCTGPNCSKSPVPFSPVPAAPVSQFRNTDPAALLGCISVPSAGRRITGFPESERGGRYVPSSIFRPPAA